MTKQGINAASDASDRKLRFLLVVDSDANNLFYTSALLKRFDYRTCTARTARQAIELTSIAAPSLVITALGLKDMDGLELIQRLKENPAFAAVPFIAMGKQGDLRAEMRSFDLGALDCLDQPVSAERLYRAVQAATETRPRTCIRLRTLLPVKENNSPLNDPENACTTDLSERGMFLRAAKPFGVNTRLPLQIYLYGQVVPVEAVVVYSDATGGGPFAGPGMGLEFVQIAPKDRELIRQFVRNEVTRGIGPGNA
jgi:CheY-like chemotaxis protein